MTLRYSHTHFISYTAMLATLCVGLGLMCLFDRNCGSVRYLVLSVFPLSALVFCCFVCSSVCYTVTSFVICFFGISQKSNNH